jgi:hypothetical protein
MVVVQVITSQVLIITTLQAVVVELVQLVLMLVEQQEVLEVLE